MPTVYVTRAIPDLGITKLQESVEVDVWGEEHPIPKDILLKNVSGCKAILSMLSDRIDAEVMDAAGPQLQVIANYAVGFNNIDVAEATKRGIRVGNTPDVLSNATADLAFALLISAARRTSEAEAFVRNGKWATWLPRGFIGQDLEGKTIGIVGMGRIGEVLARRCHRGWGMNVLYCSRTAKPRVEQELKAQRCSFEDLLQRSDFISVHAPLNEGTRGLFDAKAFSLMRENCVFINTARGQIVNQQALYEALVNRQIFSAGLDVTDPEPLPMDSPLHSLPNCIILPHIGSATLQSRNDMAEIAADNILLGLQGKALRCSVNDI